MTHDVHPDGDRERGPPLPLGLPKERERKRGAFIAALIVQLVMFVGIASVFSMPIIEAIRVLRDNPPIQEQITHIVPPRYEDPRPPPPDTSALRRNEPTRRPPPVRPPPSPLPPPAVAPPVEIPVGVVPPRNVRSADSIRAAAGGGGPPGLVPPRVDPRLMGVFTPPPVVDRPMRADGISVDSAVANWVLTYWDSIARVQSGPKRNPLDWTVERKGQKYGLDPGYIYFGKFKVPTAVLALLPIKMQPNPSSVERNRALESMRQEIAFQALRAVNDDDFRERIKAIRARKEAEKRDSLRKKGGL